MPQECILGIDAAWTARQPSGIALVTGSGSDWRCIAVEPSYEEFIRRSNLQAVGTSPQPALLLEAAERLSQTRVTVVSLDIPLARTPITCRRTSDNVVSQRFGQRGCGTHSPSAERPGPISKMLYEGFSTLGFELLTTAETFVPKKMIEVYPHVALLRLLNVGYRIAYKIGKSSQYMRNIPLRERIDYVWSEMMQILSAIHEHIGGINLSLPTSEEILRSRQLKPYEDMLDALVCCWMGMRLLNGQAVPLGDEHSAIWVPKPLERMVLYHTTTAKTSEHIISDGFKDATDRYLTKRLHTGVWLANTILDANDGIRGGTVLRVTLSLAEQAIEDYEWIAPNMRYREWLIPADLVNHHIETLEVVS